MRAATTRHIFTTMNWTFATTFALRMPMCGRDLTPARCCLQVQGMGCIAVQSLADGHADHTERALSLGAGDVIAWILARIGTLDARVAEYWCGAVLMDSIVLLLLCWTLTPCHA